jgi:hypothetical protein
VADLSENPAIAFLSSARGAQATVTPYFCVRLGQRRQLRPLFPDAGAQRFCSYHYQPTAMTGKVCNVILTELKAKMSERKSAKRQTSPSGNTALPINNKGKRQNPYSTNDCVLDRSTLNGKGLSASQLETYLFDVSDKNAVAR